MLPFPSVRFASSFELDAPNLGGSAEGVLSKGLAGLDKLLKIANMGSAVLDTFPKL